MAFGLQIDPNTGETKDKSNVSSGFTQGIGFDAIVDDVITGLSI